MMELDAIDRLAAATLEGYLVRKDLVRTFSRQFPVPTYVVEFLLGRYCASVDEKEIGEGLAIVEKQLEGRTVRTSDQEVFKSRAREDGSVKLIDIVRARLEADTPWEVLGRSTAGERVALRWPSGWRGKIASQVRFDLTYAPDVTNARVDRLLLYPRADAYRGGIRAH